LLLDQQPAEKPLRYALSLQILYIWRYAMRAVVLHEYGGPEKLKFEDNVPTPQISGSTVLIVAAAASVNPRKAAADQGIRT
jgi:hypothetical protein